MQTLIFLGAVLLVLRAAGALGVRRFDTWRSCAAHALAAMLVMTGATHFLPDALSGGPAPTHGDLVPMVPPFVPFPDAMVYLTGVLELLGAAGLVLTGARRRAGIALAVLFAVMLPANIHAALSDIPLGAEAAAPLWERIPEQLIYIAVALWAAGLRWRATATSGGVLRQP
ncbi:putative membrane protein [Nocardia nova SH22a]|uniref:Putative membrane protein n=1 Tax=Nocardia nova SH22a TaxID=1415166 RepID=W5TKI5_9NOCA|nr:hypothetical protein [Nocardia nova]AHH17751.1 putative membrane protein [Nocardia nova SH22a]